MGFNASWLRGGHPILNIGDLATEASKSLVLLLDQLRSPAVKSLSNLTIVVLINRYILLYVYSICNLFKDFCVLMCYNLQKSFQKISKSNTVVIG